MSWKSKTFDGPLPALAIRGPELRQSLRVVTIATLYLTAHGVCISGAHFNNFFRMLGFDDFYMGLLTSLPPLAVFAQILATLPIERTGLRKHQYIQCSLWARLGWIAIAAIGLLVLLSGPSRLAVWIALLVFVGMACLDSFAGPAGTTWIADILPRRIRARYVAAQQTLARMVQLVLTVVVSLLLDWATMPVKGSDGKILITVAAQPLLFRMIMVLFLVAGLLGLSMFLFHRIREVFPPVARLTPLKKKPAKSSPVPHPASTVPAPVPAPAIAKTRLRRLWTRIASCLDRFWNRVVSCMAVAANRCAVLAIRWAKTDSKPSRAWAVVLIRIVYVARILQTMPAIVIDPLRNRAFRQFTICTMVLGFGANVGGIYLWQNCGPANLGFSNLASNMIFIFGGTLASLLTLRPLGRLVDRFGRKPVMVLCAFATVLGILPWAFITKGMGDVGISSGLNRLCQGMGGLFGHGNFVLIDPGLPVGAFLVGLATASFAGIAWAGVGLAQANYIFGFSDLEGRSKYIAAFSVITSLGVMVAGVAGGMVTKNLEYLQNTPLVMGPIAWNNWHVSFVIGGAARFVAALMMLRLPDDTASSPGDLLNYMAGGLPRLVARLFPFGGR